MKDERGFLINAKVIKKRWLRPDIIRIEITDGKNTDYFDNVGSFTVDTEIPFPEPVIKKDKF